MKIAFDIGGVISKYPERMKALMQCLVKGGAEVYILTDMPSETALKLCALNGIDFIAQDRILCASWTENQDLCKTVLCKRLGIDFLIDDRPDYCASGDFIGLVLAPRPHLPYFHHTWRNE